MVSRRRVLRRASAVALAAATAGCASLPGSNSATEVGSIRAQNHLADPVDVQVLLTDGGGGGGDPVYWQSRTVPAAAAGDDDSDDSDDGPPTREFTGLPASAGAYTLHARTRAYPEDDWETVDLAASDASCKAFVLEVGGDGPDAGADSLVPMSSSNENYCAEDGWN